MKTIWNYNLYRKLTGNLVGTKAEDGLELVNKKDVYNYLSNKLGIAAPSTFASWAKTSSNPPTTISLKILESYFNQKLVYYEKEDDDQQDSNKIQNNYYHAFILDHAYSITKLIKAYINETSMQDETEYYDMIDKINMELLFMPQKIKYLINNYINTWIEPFIFDTSSLQDRIKSIIDFWEYQSQAELELERLMIKDIKGKILGIYD